MLKQPEVPIEKVNKYPIAYLAITVVVLLFAFVGAYMNAMSNNIDACEEEKVLLREEIAEYKKENRELLTANYVKSRMLYSIDSLARTRIDEKDVKRTVETNKQTRP